MFKKYIIYSTLLFTMNLSLAAENNIEVEDKIAGNNVKTKLIVNEKYIKDVIKNGNLPNVEKLNMMVQQSYLNKILNEEKYTTNLSGGVNKFSDNNDIDITMYDAKVSKNFAQGFDLSIAGGNMIDMGGNKLYLDKTMNFGIMASIDLRKNFLGYTDLANRLSLKYNYEQSKLKNEIELNNFSITLLKLYYTIVYKEKEIKIYEILLKQAEKNLENTLRKAKDFIADKGDVARMRADYYSRKSNLESSREQKLNLITQMKTLIPNLINVDIEFENINFADTLTNIKQCNNNIFSNKDVDKYTSYFEYVSTIDNEIEQKLKSLEHYSDMDVKLVLGTNVRDDIANYNGANIEKNDYVVGLNLSKPISGEKEDAKINQIKLIRMNHNSNKKDLLIKIYALYEQYPLSTEYLLKILNNKIEIKNNIEIRVENMRKKYTQGRISLTDLIQDEDTLVESHIGLLQIENLIIDTLLSYNTIFNKLECNLSTMVK